MTDFDIGKLSSSVMGIAGMGISLGLLAGIAKNMSNATGSMFGQNNNIRERRTTRRATSTQPTQQPSRLTTRRRPSMYDNYWMR